MQTACGEQFLKLLCFSY